MRLKIYGTGSALPAKKVSNDLLSEYMDTSDEWIRSRTGIVNRRLAMEETTSSLAVEAGRKALEDAKAAPEEVEIVIVATFTSDCSLPSTACIVQDQLGLTHAVAFDLNAACSGFLFALNTVQAYFSAGVYRTALVIGAENISKVVDWKDRGTCVLFGDGAGAALCRAVDGAACNFVQKSDGSGRAVLSLKERPIAHLFRECDEKPGKMYMNGQEVFKFAVRKVPECIHEVLDLAYLKPEEVDWYLLHQANKRIISSVAKRLGIPEEKFPTNLEEYGNTSAASIPILLDEVNRKGMLKEGDILVLSGFGAGLTWGACLLEW